MIIRTDDDYRPSDDAARRAEFGLNAPKKTGSTPVQPSAYDKVGKAGDANKFPLERTDTPGIVTLNDDEKSVLPDANTKDTTSSDTAIEQNGLSKEPVEHDTGGVVRERKKQGALKRLFHHEGKAKEGDDEAKPKQKFTAMGQFRATVLNSWINILLIACKVRNVVGQVMVLMFSSAHWHRCFLRKGRASRSFRHQLHCHHPSSGNAQLCHRGNCSENWRNARWSAQCVLWVSHIPTLDQ